MPISINEPNASSALATAQVYQLLRNRWVAVVPLPPVAESDPEAADGIEAPTAFCGIQTRLKLWQDLIGRYLEDPSN